MNPDVDRYLSQATKWKNEMVQLRKILLGCHLTEELKWGKPCYTFEGKNVAIIQGFKGFCALLIARGALLKDPEGILEKPGENTQAARRIPFTSVREITARETTIKAYLHEAVAAQQAGLEVTYKKSSEFALPAELQERLKENPALKTAFYALTPGRQRGYVLHISAAKQSKTRESRITQWTQQILEGKGIHDR